MNRGRKKLAALLVFSALCLLGLSFACVSDFSYVREQIQQWAGFFGENADDAGADSHEIQGPGAVNGSGSLLETQTEEEPVNTGEEYAFDVDIYPYFGMLSDSQQAVYRQIYANALVQNSSFTLAETLTESAFSDAVCAVYNDHPELFWLETTYTYSYNSRGEVLSMKLCYYMTGTELKQAQSSFDAVVETLVAGAAAYATEIEQELYVHDSINQMTDYDTSAAMNQSAYSALVNGSTVCAGYARAFQCVMQELGYLAYYCTGTSDGQEHAWNIIEIEGEFYNVDLTWDDSISKAYGANVYTYFNLTDAAISVDHTRSALSSNLPACTSTDMAYTSVYGDTISIDDIDVGDGTPADEGMIITPSAPDIVDWNNAPVQSEQNTDNGAVPQEVPTEPGGNGDAAPSEPGGNGGAAPTEPTGNGGAAPSESMQGNGSSGQQPGGDSPFFN